jgi:hypothetical protein
MLVLRILRPLFCTFLLTAGALSALLPGAFAQVDSLEAGFHEPPDSAKPQTWWHWMNGNITKEGITMDLEAMKRVGIGGAQIFNVDCDIPAGPVKFMSPEWRGLMLHAVREAERLGLELCVHNGAGWSSSGGPWNTAEHSMQRVTTSEQKVKGPSRFASVLPLPPKQKDYYRDIAILAFPTIPSTKPLRIANIEAKGGFNGEFVLSSPTKTNTARDHALERTAIIDLTSRLQPDGRLEWDVPAGDWTVLRIGNTSTGEENHPAPNNGRGLECDKFSKEALDAHWAGFVQKVLDDAGPLAGTGKALDNVLIDSYEVGGQNWTPQFASEFAQRRGYEPLLYLPTLTGRVVDSPEISERFLWDMRRTIADLFADNYYGHFQKLCHAHGLKASFEPYTGPFDSLQSGAWADIPMGEFWVGGEPDQSVKLAASVGHIYGKPIVGAESFTAGPSAQHGRWLDDPSSLKTLGDLVFCRGVNRFIFHRYAMQPWTNRVPGMTMGQWGTHFDRTSTWWEQGRSWLQYVARCQFMLQQGQFVADAAYFCGESAPVELRVGNPALPPGYDWDAVDADVLLNHATMKGGCLCLDSGMKYRVLILPPGDSAMRTPLLRQLSRFVENGLTLVGPRPQSSPSLEDYPKCDDEVKQVVTQMWGDCDGRRVTQHKMGQGQVSWGQQMVRVMNELGMKPDFEYPSRESNRVAFIHRRDGDTDIYFVSNQQNRFVAIDGIFRVEGKVPEFWEPKTGRRALAPVWHELEGRTVVSLSLEPAGSMFVVFRAKVQDDHLVAVQSHPASEHQARLKPAKIKIHKAVYGIFSEKSADVTEKVRSLLSDGTREIRASNDLTEDDDPAPGVVKRLRVEFLLDGKHKTLTAVEGSTLKLPPGSVAVKALYGDLAGDSSWVDVTQKVEKLVGDGENRIVANNDLAGSDPAPNVVKSLVVEYSLGEHRHKVEVREGGAFQPPEGAKITKATYGSPKVEQVAPRKNVDVTAKLARLAKAGGLNVRVDNALAGRDPTPTGPKELRVDYSLNGERRHATVQENENLTIPENALPGEANRGFTLVQALDTPLRLLAWASGEFDFTWASGRQTTLKPKSVPLPIPVSGAWRVSFPPGWHAPACVRFDHLQSWTERPESGVKYFSGTATYQKEIDIPAEFLAHGREVWLDLGVVKNFAEVSLNGQSLGLLWKRPFRVNATSAAHAGQNTLIIKVTNLWPNRLIGDEQLPPDCQWNGKQLKSWPQWLLDGKPSPTGRLTFTTWHHWKKSDPLLDSGLVGPVTLQTAEVLEIR